MTVENGDPSPALIQEVKRQMKEMEEKKGSTEMMPQELKDLVLTASKEEVKSGNLISTQVKATDLEAEKILDTAMLGGNFLRPAIGVNPVALMTKVLGIDNMKTMLKEVIDVAQEFPALTNDQIVAAQSLTASIATNSDNQMESFGKFVFSLSQVQVNIISKMEQKLFSTLKQSMANSKEDLSAFLQKN